MLVTVKCLADRVFNDHDKTWYDKGTVFETTDNYAKRYANAGICEIVENKALEENVDNKAIELKYGSKEQYLDEALTAKSLSDLKNIAAKLGITEKDIQGSGVEGKVIRPDWIRVISEVS